MSRSNPFKRKRRAAKHTLLIYGEGLAEELFLKLIRRFYAKDSGVSITIRRGKGGTADGIVASASQYSGSFHQRVVMLDNDKPEAEMVKARGVAKSCKIELIENTPCLEALLLLILAKEIGITKTSQQCKKEFERDYIEKKKRSEILEYERLYPKKLLDERRKKITILNRLISIMENKND